MVRIPLFLLVSCSITRLSDANHLRGNTLQQQPPIQTRIVNGQDVADPNRYPYFTMISGRKGLCGGALIAPDIVITAAHCRETSYQVEVGKYIEVESDVVIERTTFLGGDADTAETLPIQQEIFFPDYPNPDNFYAYDVMLLHLAESSTKPVVKVRQNPYFPDPGNTIFTVLGFGVTSTSVNDAILAAKLQEVEIAHIDNIKCQRLHGNTVQISSDMLCAMEERKDACYGDGGGPMLLQGDSYLSDELVATVSTGKGCTGQYPGIYSRTSYFYDWIAETVCNISQDPPNWYKCQLRTPAPTTSQMPSMAPTLGRELEFVAWSPSQPLNECQGDCDTDQDCAGDFVCFPATGASQVPGCKGNPWSFPFSDFCVLPQKEQAEIISTQVPTTNATQVPDVNATLAPTSTNATLALTTDCATLAPSIGNATLAPTSSNATQAPTTDCATLALTTTNTTLAPTTNATILDQLLEEESNLTALEAIQDLSTSAPTISNNLLLSFVSWDPTEPLGACQGDCDRDEDCLGDMVCLSRSSTPDRSIPGCQESTAYIPSIAHFCASSLNKMEEQQNPATASPIADTLMTTAVPAAQFALPDVVLEFVTWDSTEPLDHCQGDCDNNADCAGELICWKNVNPPGCARSSGSYVPSIAHFCVYPE